MSFLTTVMNEIFAIEPTSFDDDRDILHVMDRFGFHEGRFVSEFPKKWVRLVYEHIDTFPDLKRKKAEVAFAKYRHNCLVPVGYPYSPDKTWIENAREAKEHNVVADVIASRVHGDGAQSTGSIDAEYFAQWGGRQAEILSSARNYADVASMLLLLSHEVAIVDPYIGCFESRFQVVLEEMAMIAARGRCRKFLVFSMEDRSTTEQIARGARSFFLPVLKLGISVTYRVLRDIGKPDADNHGRFVFSIKGAMQFDHGFDQEDPPRMRKVAVLDRPVHDRLCLQYLEGELPFSVVSEVEL